MSDSLTTRLDRPYGQQPATRAAALRVLEARDALDLVEALGLGPEPERPAYIFIGGRQRCAVCWAPVRADGVCRQRVCGGRR